MPEDATQDFGGTRGGILADQFLLLSDFQEEAVEGFTGDVGVDVGGLAAKDRL